VEGLSVIDAYCGIGTLGRELARQGGQVTGIESDHLAAAAANETDQEGFTLAQARVEEILEDLLPADLVLLNPPRAGIDGEVAEALAKAVVPRVIYVSCDPATLARDLTRMGPRYRVEGIRSFDLFPQTDHVETVAVLARTDG
jgi:23S rRNA (uracil1939-C5)-methyltransferase